MRISCLRVVGRIRPRAALSMPWIKRLPRVGRSLSSGTRVDSEPMVDNVGLHFVSGLAETSVSKGLGLRRLGEWRT